jgi:O-antigen ligase
VSRLTLLPVNVDFQPSHCHNEFLESLFSMGVIGFTGLVMMFLYNLKWVTHFSFLQRAYPKSIALHGVAVIVIFLVSSMFETRITEKLRPLQPLFFYYLLLLDRAGEFAFSNLKKQ